ncbi:serine hydrolase FSH [Xylaria bambusicola]|uniref:serine hydrolase FSH n=1 Tax=Xylaria bambusicola TaxID=326684 RepID=UPI002008B63B|nr:serine hydrolase FSH [Xylaria bambusicola]KAI0509537.1 serine hydrolase FSH [Xylaria bambusicola]
MRFLCLHGRGTNAEIFKSQTSCLREAISEGNEFVFINGRIQVDEIPGVSSVVKSRPSERLGFVPLPADAETYQAFFLEIQQLIRANGPFDGLFGFSEGAGVAVTLLVDDARRQFANFKCAVLFCALDTVSPDDLNSSPSNLRLLDPETDRVLVTIPTAHIWSSRDKVANCASQRIADLFEPTVREVVVHELGHDIPGASCGEKVQDTVRAIERTIGRV